MHAERADKIPLHQPERLGQQQGVGHLLCHAVHHLAPEFVGHQAIKLRFRQAVFRPRWNGTAGTWFGEPQSLVVFLGQRHRCVKTDDGELPGNVQNRLDHRLPDLGIEVVQLGGVVPGHTGGIVAVVDVLLAAGPVVHALEDHRGVGTAVVMVLQIDPYALIPREIGAVEGVGGERAVVQRDEPVWMLDHPLGVDAHVVGHHVAGQADASPPRPLSQVLIRRIATQISRDLVVKQRVGRCDRLGIPAHLFDPARCRAALPEADQPQAGEAPTGQLVEGLVGDLVQAVDGALKRHRELVQPHVGVLGHQHQAGHPVAVRAKALRLEL